MFGPGMWCDGSRLNRSGCLVQAWQMDSCGVEAAQGLEATTIIVGLDEQLQVVAQLVVAAVMVSLDRGVLDGAVHPLELAIRRAWIARRIASVVVALPWRTCPMARPSLRPQAYHHTKGLNIYLESSMRTRMPLRRGS